MALCPFAVHELLPENSLQNRINPTTVICHRAVSSAEDLYGYWNSPGIVLESHFYISESGTIYQYMDTEVRADANVQANAFAVSIETWDGGNTPDSWGWNDPQVYALKRLIQWICDVHGISKTPAQTWNGGGIGGHNWFPTEWADGPRGCPGTERNNQLRNDIIPAVASGNIEDEMSSQDAYEGVARLIGDMEHGGATATGDELAKIVLDYEFDTQGDAAWKPYKTTVGAEMKYNAYNFKRVYEALARIEDKVEVGGVDYNKLADAILARLDVDLVRRTGS